MHLNMKDLKFARSVIKKGMIHLNLQLLYKCNFKCRICDFWKSSYKDHPMLSAKDVQVISNKIAHFGPQIISIGGGEPLLHPEIPEVTSILAKNNYPVMICNGWYVDREIARELFKAGMHEVSISLDYADPAKHDAQRGIPGAFDKAVNALQILNESRVHRHQRVHMISVVMHDNIDDIEKLILLSREIGITYLVTLYSGSRGENETNANNNVSEKLLELKRKYKDFVAIPGYMARFTESIKSKEGITPCYTGKNLYNIDSGGNVTLCIDRLDLSAGNILTDDIREIEANLLKLHETNQCGKCWTSCRGAFETLLYDKNKIKNYKALFESILDVPLTRAN